MSPVFRNAVPLVAVAILATACNGTHTDATASLCQDLRNLRATVTFLETPAAGASVGQVRGDIEKLGSTVASIDGSVIVPEAMGEALSQARDDYRDVLDGVGDDDPFSEVGAEAAAPAQRLGTAYDAVAQHLACDEPSPA